MDLADRLKQLPPYVFAELDRKKAALKAKGVDLIDVSIGDPDRPTPASIVEAMMAAVRDVSTHQYPPYAGTKAFREAACAWMRMHYQVELDADQECLALIGSKEGIAHLSWAFVNPGDVVLVPSPGYPVYSSSTLFVGAVPHILPLKAERNFLPDLTNIAPDVLKKAKILWLNYPNNPTAAVATEEFFQEAIRFAKEFNIVVAHDAAYTEIAYDGYRPLSFLQIPGAKQIRV